MLGYVELRGQLIGDEPAEYACLAGTMVQAAFGTNPAIREVEKVMAPKQAAYQDTIALNGPLFARIEAIYAQRDTLGLDPESRRLLERYRKDFIRAGARLSDADKTKLKAYNA